MFDRSYRAIYACRKRRSVIRLPDTGRIIQLYLVPIKDSGETPSTEHYVVYRYRWVVLTLYCFSAALNSLHWTQYTIIQDVLVPYYNVPSIVVYWTSIITMVLFIIFMPGACILLTKTNLRVVTILGVGLTCLGSWLKVISVPRHLFWLGFTGQILASIAQVFIMNIPPRLAAVWFGDGQVSTACSIGVFGDEVGVALGFLLPPMLVRANVTFEETASDLRLMFYIIAGITTAVTILIVLFFKAAPPTPPTSAALHSNSIDPNFLQCLKNLFTNRNYNLLLISFSINVGTFYAISTLLNEVVLIYFPTGQKDAGQIGLVIVVAGMAGSLICGLILDKTHRYKETTFAVYVASVLGLVMFTFSLKSGYIATVYLSSGFLGFFMMGYLPVGYEFASEITYPEPEGTTSGMLNSVVQIFGIFITLLYEWVITIAGDLESHLMLCGMLLVGTVITAAIGSDLRRQAAMKHNNPEIKPT